jgi:23S rRNA pseudouridine2605 synthase
MVFKRPRNSRDDNSGRSNNRTSNSDDRSKKTTSARRNSSPGAGQSGEKSNRKSFGSAGPSEQKSSTSSSRGKSFESRDNDGNTSASSFSSSQRSTFKGKKTPYTGRATDGGGGSSFGARKKPYSGRVSDNDERPKRAFKDDTASPKKSFSSRAKASGSFDSESKPQRSRTTSIDYNVSGKPQRSRTSTSGFNSEDKPKRGRPSTGGFSADARPKRDSFKKTASDKPFNADRPQRSKPTYDKITPDLDAPAKTLRGRKKGPESKDSGLIRLNRYISNAGICSRRKADELISAGVVSVNGIVISELGHKVDPQRDEIRYNGELLKREKMVYVLLNKPKDYITTTEDPHERRTVMHLVEKASKERIYPIGRLDRNTTGLLLMTNDGDLADKLSHPKNNISKLYQVELSKSLTQGDLNKIGFGIELEDGLIKPDSISYVSGGSKREIGIQIHSGKNRIVRRIFESLGYEVVKLDRVVYANLTKKDLPRGRWRYLDESEIIQLKHLM